MIAAAQDNADAGQGLEAVLIKERGRLLRFLSARTGNADEAEDIVQEIWLRVTQSQLGPIGSPLSYLHKIGLNIIIDRRREQFRRERRDGQWTGLKISSTPDGQAVDDAPSPARAIEARQRVQRLAIAIASLPAGAQRVFKRHKLEGATHAELARELGISRSGVEKHMAVALKHLMIAVSDDED